MGSSLFSYSNDKHVSSRLLDFLPELVIADSWMDLILIYFTPRTLDYYYLGHSSNLLLMISEFVLLNKLCGFQLSGIYVTISCSVPDKELIKSDFGIMISINSL